MCSYRVPQDDKYGLSLGLLSNLSETGPGALWTAHCSQRCLWKVFMRKKREHLGRVDHSSLLLYTQKKNGPASQVHGSECSSVMLRKDKQCLTKRITPLKVFDILSQKSPSVFPLQTCAKLCWFSTDVGKTLFCICGVSIKRGTQLKSHVKKFVLMW